MSNLEKHVILGFDYTPLFYAVYNRYRLRDRDLFYTGNYNNFFGIIIIRNADPISIINSGLDLTNYVLSNYKEELINANIKYRSILREYDILEIPELIYVEDYD